MVTQHLGGPAPLLVLPPHPHPNWFPSFLVAGMQAAFLPWEVGPASPKTGEIPLSPPPLPYCLQHNHLTEEGTEAQAGSPPGTETPGVTGRLRPWQLSAARQCLWRAALAATLRAAEPTG